MELMQLRLAIIYLISGEFSIAAPLYLTILQLHLDLESSSDSIKCRSTSAPMMIPATHDERPTFALASCNFRFPRRAPPGTRINIARLLILHSYFKPQL
ncbi:PREDICTED: uncharacterized protein LOC106327233 isoform X4 [Brassica oleracea var. oleracea]|uniref:uncharacterized protein LOC106327233 isoform X4 n=1 Tax=Brassica oleracea var. oleracea TaxID=109376 RepID=UPI0006A74ABC|nr:PREDICTED: uncharacterized protein LOC106327233 isoform X4 [Brassica oleracea var. oleracea]